MPISPWYTHDGQAVIHPCVSKTKSLFPSEVWMNFRGEGAGKIQRQVMPNPGRHTVHARTETRASAICPYWRPSYRSKSLMGQQCQGSMWHSGSHPPASPTPVPCWGPTWFYRANTRWGILTPKRGTGQTLLSSVHLLRVPEATADVRRRTPGL